MKAQFAMLEVYIAASIFFVAFGYAELAFSGYLSSSFMSLENFRENIAIHDLYSEFSQNAIANSCLNQYLAENSSCIYNYTKEYSAVYDVNMSMGNGSAASPGTLVRCLPYLNGKNYTAVCISVGG